MAKRDLTPVYSVPSLLNKKKLNCLVIIIYLCSICYTKQDVLSPFTIVCPVVKMLIRT